MEHTNLINQQIQSFRVMLLDNDGNKLGEFPLREAIYKAQSQNLDLMQVGQNQDTAICKILNFESWLYHENKNKQKQEFKNRSQEMKSMTFRPAIGDNDFNLKMKKINEFLKENHKVKIIIKFKSFRETTMKELNNLFIQKIVKSIEDNGSLDSQVNFGGRDINFLLKPTKKITPKIKP